MSGTGAAILTAVVIGGGGAGVAWWLLRKPGAGGLQATINGPTVLQVGQSGTFSVSVSGGTPPYTYDFISTVTGSQAGNTYTALPTVTGSDSIFCKVTDALGNTTTTATWPFNVTTGCPATDFVMPTGGCGSNYTADPFYPGCCYNCPNVCASDADCQASGCPVHSVCETSLETGKNACVQPQLSTLTASLGAVNLKLSAQYSSSCDGCGFLGLSSCCNQCQPAFNAIADGITVTVVARDKADRPMAGVPFNVDYTATYFYTQLPSDYGQNNNVTTRFVTGADGTASFVVRNSAGVMPSGYGNIGDYPCDSCSYSYAKLECTGTNRWTINGPVQGDVVSIISPAWPGPEALFTVFWVIDVSENVCDTGHAVPFICLGHSCPC